MEYVALGIHAGDAYQYPDCRGSFIQSAQQTLCLANEGFIRSDFELLAPFIDRSKADIARRAYELEVPLESTWSCYAGGEVHCGRCGTCVERLEAIDKVSRVLGITSTDWDHTVYTDTAFWQSEVEKWKARDES